MIRAFKGSYIRFEDENQKRKDTFIVFEILHKKMDSIQVIVCNETHLLLATTIKTITEIAGYHRYEPVSTSLSPFGIGGLTKLPTDSNKGMLEGIASASHLDYNLIANSFGRGLLEIHNDYISFLD